MSDEWRIGLAEDSLIDLLPLWVKDGDGRGGRRTKKQWVYGSIVGSRMSPSEVCTDGYFFALPMNDAMK